MGMFDTFWEDTSWRTGTRVLFQPVVSPERETVEGTPGCRQKGRTAMTALSERDRRVLAFERRTWRTAGAKEQDIAEALGMSATRYYQVLNELIDLPEALQFDPSLVKRLRAQRARRASLRSQ